MQEKLVWFLSGISTVLSLLPLQCMGSPTAPLDTLLSTGAGLAAPTSAIHLGSRAQELQEEPCSEQHHCLFICLFLMTCCRGFRRTKQTAADSSATVSSDREREARLVARDSAKLADRTN